MKENSGMIEQTPDAEPWNTGYNFKFKLLNLNEITDNPEIHISVRHFARLLISDYSSGVLYRQSGGFFKLLSDYMLDDFVSMQQWFDEEYLEWISKPTEKNSYNLRNLTTLALLLSRAEGQTEITPDVLQLTINWLCKTIREVSKARGEGKEVGYNEISIMQHFDAVYLLKKD